VEIRGSVHDISRKFQLQFGLFDSHSFDSLHRLSIDILLGDTFNRERSIISEGDLDILKAFGSLEESVGVERSLDNLVILEGNRGCTHLILYNSLGLALPVACLWRRLIRQCIRSLINLDAVLRMKEARREGLDAGDSLLCSKRLLCVG
jgi:hypothetical protein